MDEWLLRLSRDLKRKTDRPDAVDGIALRISSDDPETKGTAVWCLGKLAQNKVCDDRILGMVLNALNEDAQIREDAAWCIGEAAGAGMFSDEALRAVIGLMDDDDVMVRGMAAWAAGRLMHRQNANDPKMKERLNELLDDGSEYVRKAAEFALNG